MAIRFEGYERRIDKINACLAEYGIASLEEARQICLDKGVNAEEIVKGNQSLLKTLFGHIHSVAQSQLNKASQAHQKLQKQSVSVCRHSAFLVL